MTTIDNDNTGTGAKVAENIKNPAKTDNVHFSGKEYAQAGKRVLSLGADAYIKVTPEVLKNKADEVSKNIGTMDGLLSSLETIVRRTEFYWIGEAGNLHRSLYYKQKEDIAESMKRFREHPKDLLSIAHVYENVEREVAEISNQLPGDVIK